MVTTREVTNMITCHMELKTSPPTENRHIEVLALEPYSSHPKLFFSSVKKKRFENIFLSKTITLK